MLYSQGGLRRRKGAGEKKVHMAEGKHAGLQEFPLSTEVLKLYHLISENLKQRKEHMDHIDHMDLETTFPLI